MQVPVGYLSDRIGRKRLVFWGGLIPSFAPFIFFYATRWEHLIPGVILEAFTNVVLPARQAMFADAIEADKRATAFATIHTLFSFFSTAMPILGGFLLERFEIIQGMRMALLFSGVVMIITGVCRGIFLRETMIPTKRNTDFNMKETIQEMFEPVINLETLRVAIFAAFLFSLAVGFLTNYSVVYAVDVIGLSKVQWGIVAGGMGLVGIVTRIPIGLIIDRFSRKLCILISYATRPILILAFTVATNFPQILIIQMADNIFSYVQQPALEALVTDIASKEKRGRAYGALNFVPGTALMFGPVLGAYLWDLYGAPWAFYASALASAAAAIIISVFLNESEKNED
jgi:MFS family permease